MESIYKIKIYSLILNPKKHLLNQIGMEDKFKNPLSNALYRCLNDKNIEFSNNIGLFKIIDITENYLLCSYASCPAINNPNVVNVDYSDYTEQPKQQASAYKTIFYIDIEKSILMLLEISEIKGFSANLIELLNDHDITMNNVYYDNWKEKVIQEIKEISSVEVKKKLETYTPKIGNLSEKDQQYLSSKIKVTCKIRDFVETVCGDLDSYEKLVVSTPSKSYDFIKQIIKAHKQLTLNPDHISFPEKNALSLIDKFKTLSTTINICNDILLE